MKIQSTLCTNQKTRLKFAQSLINTPLSSQPIKEVQEDEAEVL